jgi:tetratricopeptide (TPR) repeat protein
MSILKKIFHSKEETNELKDGSLPDMDAMLKTAWAARELEFKQQPDNLKLRASESSRIDLGKLLSVAFDIRKEELGDIQVVSESKSIVKDDIDQIWKLDVFDLLKHDVEHGKEVGDEDITIIIKYRPYRRGDNNLDKDKSILKEEGTIILNLRIVGGLHKHSVYLQASINIPPFRFERDLVNGNTNQAQNLTLLLAYDYRHPGETEAEIDLILDGLIKNANGEVEEPLTTFEMDMLSHLYVNDARVYYLGKRALTEHRYLDAILYLTKVFNSMQSKWWEKSIKDEEFEIMMEASFLIGFSYFEISAFEKALKFVEFAANSVQTKINYKTEYVNVLIALKDIRSSNVLDHYQRELLEVGENTWTKGHTDFYEFIMRRKAYLLIEMGELDAAEEMLKKMLEKHPEYDFALDELAYIEQLKKEK